jgi:hypothetical protein
MDTAKVDIEKLQLLNDRIVQMIEALNQVRMSVHGLQSRQGQVPGAQLGGFGLSHTGGAFGQQSPWAQQSPWTQQSPWAVQQNPWLQQQYAQYPQQTIPGIGGFGLSHTGFDPYRQGAVDPMIYARIVQTFPFLAADVQNTRQFF